MPTVQRVRLAYNNVYLLASGEQRLLVDTGPDFDGAAERLTTEIGEAPPDLTVATHGHLDHAGLGAWWQRRRVPVALHEHDAHFAAGRQLDDAEFDGLVAYVRVSGAPAEVIAEVLAGLQQRRAWARATASERSYRPSGRDARWPTGLRYEPFVPDRWLGDSTESLPAGAEFLHMPGHTPGNGVVWLAQEGWLFSGDQLLPEITPTPALQGCHLPTAPWRFRSLPEFLRSLRAIRSLGATRCFPGHGEPFDDVGAVIEANLDQADQRTVRLRTILAASPGATVYSLAEALYPRALRRRFWQIIATVQGHLDVLEEASEAHVEDNQWFAG